MAYSRRRTRSSRRTRTRPYRRRRRTYRAGRRRHTRKTRYIVRNNLGSRIANARRVTNVVNPNVGPVPDTMFLKLRMTQLINWRTTSTSGLPAQTYMTYWSGNSVFHPMNSIYVSFLNANSSVLSHFSSPDPTVYEPVGKDQAFQMYHACTVVASRTRLKAVMDQPGSYYFDLTAADNNVIANQSNFARNNAFHKAVDCYVPNANNPKTMVIGTWCTTKKIFPNVNWDNPLFSHSTMNDPSNVWSYLLNMSCRMPISSPSTGYTFGGNFTIETTYYCYFTQRATFVDNGT